jgi:predicted phosphohydrolase
MEVFGHRWTNYIERLVSNWKHLVTENDTVIIPGDISWALSLDEALSDLRLIDSLPGKKILGKGNHDFWWSTMRKHKTIFDSLGIKTISFLYNNAYEEEDFIIAGTRGWYNDEDAANAPDNADFEKLSNREALRLETSLKCAMELKAKSENKEIIVFMHFPPFWNGKASDNLIEILKKYSIKKVYYGHIHGYYTIPCTFEYEGTTMEIISADYLKFVPQIVKI